MAAAVHFSFVISVAAAPLERRQENTQASSTGNTVDPNVGGVTPQVWVPAVVVVLILLGVFCVIWTRTNVMNRLRGIRTPQTSETREVTATQLANGGRNGRNVNATTRPRTRRTRRTPSQMSTTSLPAYMKEPGAQELVIFRGPEAMDASDAIAEAREAEDHEDERDSTSIIRSEPPESSTEHHLQADSDSVDNENLNVGTTTEGHHRSSSRDTVDSRVALIHPTYEVPSEAPPEYDFESGHRESSSLPSILVPPGLATSPEPTSPGLSSLSQSNVQTPVAASNPLTPESPQSSRRSRIASRVSNLLHFRNSSSISSIPPLAESEPQARLSVTGTSSNAAISAISLNDPPASPPTTPPAQHTRHRYSQSGGSSSTLNLALPFRTLSRTRSRSSNNLNSGIIAGSRSQANLASRSSLSLSLAAGSSPIGAPLSHTLVRTEILFPRGGPTPEQLKLLSSKDNPRRFGVPYGEQAVAHAEQSRLDLALDPPPIFESPTAEAGPSASRHSEDDEDPDALPSDTQQQNNDNNSSSSLERSRSTDRWQETWQENSSMHIDSARIIVPLFM